MYLFVYHKIELWKITRGRRTRGRVRNFQFGTLEHKFEVRELKSAGFVVSRRIRGIFVDFRLGSVARAGARAQLKFVVPRLSLEKNPLAQFSGLRAHSFTPKPISQQPPPEPHSISIHHYCYCFDSSINYNHVYYGAGIWNTCRWRHRPSEMRAEKTV